MDSKTETYRDVERMLCGLCHGAVRITQGALPFAEAASAANEAFIDAYVTHDPRRAKFVTWVYHRVRWALIDLVDRWKRRPDKAQEDGRELRKLPARSSGWLQTVLSDLGDDAQLMVGMVVELPESYAENAGAAARVVKLSLRLLGWPVARIIEAAAEVREAIMG